MTSLVEVDPVFLEKKLFKNRKYIFSLSQLHVSPFAKGCGSSFELEFPLPMGILCRVWLELTLTAFQQEGCVLIEPHLLRRVSSCLRMLYKEDRTSSIGDGKQGVLRNSSKLKHHRISAANHSFAFVCGSPTIPTL